MLRVAAILAVLLATTISTQDGRLRPNASTAQQSVHPKDVVDPEEGVPLYKRKHAPPDGWMSPDDRRILAISNAQAAAIRAAMPPPPPLTPVVMNGGQGGLVDDHITQFWKLGQTGAPVEMRGGCWSACTLITGFIPKERLCFAPGAFLAFHAARAAAPPFHRSSAGTWQMYATYPTEIRQWIDAHGGPYEMTIEMFWFMHDRELWLIGYPRCK